MQLFSQEIRVEAVSVLLLVTAVTSCFGQQENAANIDTNRLWEIERLVVELPNDSFGGLAALSAEEQRNWEAKRLAMQQERAMRIKAEIGIGPYLVALVDRYIAEPGRDGLPMILDAVAVRNDIPARELERYFAMADAITSGASTVPQPAADDFLVGITSVMTSHPSAKNEAMLMRMLRLRSDFTGVRLKLAAGKALASTGSQQALAEMQATAKWFEDFKEQTRGDALSNADAKLFDGYVSQLTVRYGLSTPSAWSSKVQNRQQETLKQSTHPRGEGGRSISWSVIVVLIVAATGLLWLLLKGRK